MSRQLELQLMSTLFNSLGGLFKSFFSRGFWLAAFAPVVAALGLHLMVAAIAFPGYVPAEQWLAALKTDVLALPLTFASVVLLAYAIGPLAAICRALLEGTRLPNRLYRELRRGRLEAAYLAKSEIAAAKKVFNAYAKFTKDGLDGLKKAREQGLQVGSVGGKWPQMSSTRTVQLRVAATNIFARTTSTPQAVLRAEFLERELTLVLQTNTAIARGDLPNEEAIKASIKQLDRLLRENATELPRLAEDAPDRLLAERLDDVWGDFGRALLRGRHEAEFRVQLLEDRYGPLGSSPTPRATRIGDARASAEEYSRVRYCVEFDFIWPRLLLLRTAPAQSDPVADAQALVDFAALGLFLIASVPAIWIPVLAATATNPWPLLVVGLLGPIVCAMLYELAVVAQQNLGEIIKGVIDKYRLDVLSSLNQPRPATLFAEQAIWKRVQLIDQGGDGMDVTYRYQT